MFPYLDIMNIKIPMYGICLTLGIFCSFFFALKECKKEKLVSEDLIIIAATGLLLGLTGAKITYIFITFSFTDLINIISMRNFDLIINGGFVFFGGLIGGILGAVLGAKIAKTKLRLYENILVKAIPLSHAFGRIGCLCAGCCYGKPSDSILSVTYTHPISDAPTGIPLIPIQAYEAILNLIIFVILIFVDKKYPKNNILPFLYIGLYSIIRFITEFFRYDAIRGTVGVLSTSHVIAIILLAISAILLFKKMRFIIN